MHFRTLALIAAAFTCIPTTPATGQPRALSLNAAIQAALENNTGLQLAGEQELQVRARSSEQRAALLPNFNATAGYLNQAISLGARGLRFPGIPIPSRVGPFNTSDVRLQVSEPVLDLALLGRYRASKQSVDAVSLETAALRQRVSAMVARLYYNVQRSAALIEATRAQITLDESLLKLARDRQEAGVGTGLDVTRAESRLAADRHQLQQHENDRRTAEYQLLRAMGERLNVAVELTDALAAANAPLDSIENSITAAMRSRAEVQAAMRKVSASETLSTAARSERLPTIHAFGDYGSTGNTDSFLSTHTVGVQVSLPLFDGGRRSAHQDSALSQLRQEQIRARDVRDEVEMEVRIAHDTAGSAREMLRSAEQALRLANEELDLARLRFEAQVATQIEVTTAQTGLSAARSRHVQALFALRSAEIEYLRATGQDIR